MEPSYNLNTNGTEESVHISMVSSFQGLKLVLFGERKGAHISEVFLFQGLTLPEMLLGKEGVLRYCNQRW